MRSFINKLLSLLYGVFPYMANQVGTVGTAPGMPDYTATGPSKSIPWIFSKKTVVKFYDLCTIAQISNTEYEGEIKTAGDKIIINTVPDVTIRWYLKGGTTVWQNAQSANVELDIDKAADFAFSNWRPDRLNA